MAQQLINVGAAPNDRTGDSWRDAFIKANDNFTELYQNVGDDLIFVNDEADFPVQDASSITLESGKLYFVASSFSTAKGFICEPGSALQGLAQNVPSITYTGVGTMFTGTNNMLLTNTNLACPNGQFISLSGGGSASILRNIRVTSCASIGTVASGLLAVFQCGFLSVSTGGITFTGIDNVFVMVESQLITTGGGIVAINLGTATFDQFRLDQVVVFGAPGSIALSGQPNSANIKVGSTGIVDSASLDVGGITPLSGISQTDIRWDFDSSNGVPDSRNDADAYISSPETVIVSAAGTFYEIDGGNWVSTIASRFTVGADGVATYIGETDIDVRISGVATISKVGGGSDTLEGRIAKNWTPGSSGLVQSGAQTDNTSPTSVPLVALERLTNGDNIRVIVSNQTSTSNIVVDKATLVITGV